MRCIKRITIIVVLLVTCLIKDICTIQKFAEQPRYTEVNPQQDALLTCKIIDKRGTCSWQKDNKPVGIYPKKYEWAGVPLGLQGHIGNDCSLWVRQATLEFDDGLWECQVTASDFTTQDALTSLPIRLVVRVAPQRPRLEYEGVHIPPGHNITVDTNAVATVKCVSHYGNPPALLKWFLGEQEIQPLHPQINATEPDNPRTWSAASVVQIPATRERHGNIVKCVAIHESYAARSTPVDARLDVKYAPTIRLLGVPQIDLEEGKDSLVLRCQADANPPAIIVWRRGGRSEIASSQESLQLRPVSRRDAGVYTCQAQNSVGSSETLSVQLDIKYPPKITSAGPDRLTTAPLFSPAAFECVAEGNPPPTFKWVQRIRSQVSSYLERGRDARLVIDNVTYDYQGEYECRATNFINGQERKVSSDPVALQVVGAPQVLRLNSGQHTVSVKKGESAMLSLVVCADPRPRHVAWEWGSLRLEAGAGIGRYRVDEVSQDSREDCYIASLHITEADPQDERPYYLVVENERGTDRHSVNLHVVEPFGMSYLMGIAGGCLAAFLLLICLCIYAVRSKKCCFKGRDSYKASEKDSEKADLKSRSDSLGGPQLDSIYTTPAGFHHHHHPGTGSPEAMKSTITQNGRRSPVLLHQTTTPSTTSSGLLKQNSNADLVLGGHKHHRDLFSGSLGIPDVSTHVGSVIHAFESLAHQKQRHDSGEKPYEITTGSSNKSVKSSNASRRYNASTMNISTMPNHHHQQQLHQVHFSRGNNLEHDHKSMSLNHTNREIILNPSDHYYAQQSIVMPPPPPPQPQPQQQSHQQRQHHDNDSNSNSMDNDYRKSLFSTELQGKPYRSKNQDAIGKPSHQSTVSTLQHFGQTNFVSSISNLNDSNLINNNNNNNHNNKHNFDTIYNRIGNDDVIDDPHHNEDDDDDFLRGTTVSQSFIKNVPRFTKASTQMATSSLVHNIKRGTDRTTIINNHHNVNSSLGTGGDNHHPHRQHHLHQSVAINNLATTRSLKSQSMSKYTDNELEKRYREYNGNNNLNNNNSSSTYYDFSSHKNNNNNHISSNSSGRKLRKKNYKLRSIDRNEII